MNTGLCCVNSTEILNKELPMNENSIQTEINLIGIIVDLIVKAQDEDAIRPGSMDNIVDELHIRALKLGAEQKAQ